MTGHWSMTSVGRESAPIPLELIGQPLTPSGDMVLQLCMFFKAA